jgi:hypothetical protein
MTITCEERYGQGSHENCVYLVLSEGHRRYPEEQMFKLEWEGEAVVIQGKRQKRRKER